MNNLSEASQPDESGISRRHFIQSAGIVTLATNPFLVWLEQIWGVNGVDVSQPIFSFNYLRPTDLLRLSFYFLNAEPDNINKPNTISIRKKPAYMIVRVPQQHILEQAFVDGAIPDKQAQAVLSGYSFLVFQLKRKINFDMMTLLDWTGSKYDFFELVPVRDVSAKFKMMDFQNGSRLVTMSPLIPSEPTQLFTTLEVPTGIILSPYSASDSSNSLTFKNKNILIRRALKDEGGTDDIVYQIPWYNDLIITGKNIKEEVLPSFRLIASNNLSLPAKSLPDMCDRVELLKQFQDETLGSKTFIQVKSPYFRIGSLGLTSKLDYAKPDIPTTATHSLLKWKHQMAFGRDQYVEVERAGYLYPFGIRAAYIKIGRRVINNGVCYIQSERYIAPLDTTIVYRSNEPNTSITRLGAIQRANPFKQIEVKTLMSPCIVDPVDRAKTGSSLIRNDSLLTNPAFINQVKMFVDDVNKSNNKYSLKSLPPISIGVGQRTSCINAFEAVLQQYWSLRDQYSDDKNLSKFDNRAELLVQQYRQELYLDICILPDNLETQHTSNPSGCEGTNDTNIAFWPTLSADKTSPLQFDFVGTDWDNNPIPFKATFVFVPQELVDKAQIDEQKNTPPNEIANEHPQYIHHTLETRAANAWNDKVSKATTTIAKLNAVRAQYQDLKRLDQQLRTAYQRVSSQALRRIHLADQTVAYYVTEADKKDKEIKSKLAALETEFVEFTAVGITELTLIQKQLQNNTLGVFFPQLAVAKVQLPVLKELAQYTQKTLVQYADAFKAAGIPLPTDVINQAGKNVERILLEVRSVPDKYIPEISVQEIDQVTQKIDQAVLANVQKADAIIQQYESQTKRWMQEQAAYAEGQVTNIFGQAKAQLGGIMDPSVTIKMLALRDNAFALKNEVDALTGQINNCIDATKNTLIRNVKDVKADLLHQLLSEAKIFGIQLQDLLSNINVSITQLPIAIPHKFPDRLETTYYWKTDSNTRFFENNGLFINSPDKNTWVEFNLNTVVLLNQNKSPSITAQITIYNFGLTIKDLITIYFNKVSLSKIPGKNDPIVAIDIADVEFKGALELVKTLQDLLGLKAFHLDKVPGALQLRCGISLPPISTGPFSLFNASLSAGVLLPFNGVPLLRFAFSSREEPFTLGVGIFGGRGFFGLAASPKGLQYVEASLEFGGFVGLDFGVASGQAYLMAGIYFRTGQDICIVEGFIHCGGNLSILDIVNVSVSFYLGLRYQNGALYGRASVTVSVSVLFFSASYTLTLEKRIAGTDRSFTVYNSPSQFNESSNERYGLSERRGGGPMSLDEPILAEPFDQVQRSVNPYPFAAVETKTSGGTKYTLVYDPTVIYAFDVDDMKASKYANYFSTIL